MIGQQIYSQLNSKASLDHSNQTKMDSSDGWSISNSLIFMIVQTGCISEQSWVNRHKISKHYDVLETIYIFQSK